MIMGGQRPVLHVPHAKYYKFAVRVSICLARESMSLFCSFDFFSKAENIFFIVLERHGVSVSVSINL